MLQLPNGCTCSRPKPHPANWKQAGADVRKKWYIQYRFYDPAHKQEWPKGKLVIVKAGINELHTLAEKRQGMAVLLQELMQMLQVDGYNPITKTYSRLGALDVNSDTLWLEAIRFAAGRLPLEPGTANDMAYTIRVLEKAAKKLRINYYPVAMVYRKELKLLLEEAAKSAHQFNKFRTYLMSIYNELVELDIAKDNYLRSIKKKQTVSKLRQVLTPDERAAISQHLASSYPDFLRFIRIFFHSGARVKELLALQANQVDMKALTYTVTVKKGRNRRQVQKPIKHIAAADWAWLLERAQPGDYIFSRGLVPGPLPIRHEQITRRWAVHVKKGLGIKADFYSLKHANLDETAALLDAQAAADMASHRTPVVTIKHYLPNEQQRQLERLRNVQNAF